MATEGTTRDRAGDLIDQQIRRIARLRATGPNPFDYFQWADEATGVLREVYGADSGEVMAFRSAVAESGRTIDQRGIVNNMTLGLHGPWGIWARLDRAESVLRQIQDRRA